MVPIMWQSFATIDLGTSDERCEKNTSAVKHITAWPYYRKDGHKHRLLIHKREIKARQKKKQQIASSEAARNLLVTNTSDEIHLR